MAGTALLSLKGVVWEHSWPVFVPGKDSLELAYKRHFIGRRWRLTGTAWTRCLVRSWFQINLEPIWIREIGCYDLYDEVHITTKSCLKPGVFLSSLGLRFRSPAEDARNAGEGKSLARAVLYRDVNLWAPCVNISADVMQPQGGQTCLQFYPAVSLKAIAAMWRQTLINMSLVFSFSGFKFA